MANLDFDFDLTLPPFTVSAALTVGAETLALVGPSGAGKTTVLRAIAGLARPDRGRIGLDGRDWFNSERSVSLPPEERSVGFVFQDYALFPHLSVRKNVMFGSRFGDVEVDDLLERFRIADLAKDRPATLSGGERQRVALARALARRPDVLLLDEPLSALDAHTRAAIKVELRQLLSELSLPSIFITHDFRDAAALADRVAVMVAGELRQVGVVEDLARHPADAFVAALTGNNLLPALAKAVDGGARLTLGDGQQLDVGTPASGRVGAVIAPWDVKPVDAGQLPPNALRGTVAAVTRMGGRIEARVGSIGVEWPASEATPLLIEGEQAWVELPAEAITIVPFTDSTSFPPVLDPVP